MGSARWFFLVLAFLLFYYIFRSIKKNKLSLDESILWVIGAVVILIFGCDPDLIIILANWVGIDYAPSLLFLLAIAFLLLLSMRNSMFISELKEKNKELIQNNALLDERVRELEKDELGREPQHTHVSAAQAPAALRTKKGSTAPKVNTAPKAAGKAEDAVTPTQSAAVTPEVKQEQAEPPVTDAKEAHKKRRGPIRTWETSTWNPGKSEPSGTGEMWEAQQEQKPAEDKPFDTHPTESGHGEE